MISSNTSNNSKQLLINPVRKGRIEAGCDEAGRGCLAGPVYAAAVILPENFFHPDLNDSKQVKEPVRDILRKYIEENAISYAVARVDNTEIDKINILKASIIAMHRALNALSVEPEYILVDGNKFFPYKNIPHECIVKGDSTHTAIAAASILAKTYRDEFMIKIAEEYPEYLWNENKGYPTKSHREIITRLGISPYHRKSFIKKVDNNKQLKLF
ncbi:MAG: ribonuclease HII [Prevotellaceae bacterium]|jgi:ribonuclease HII|nr:ribonuclease HII [Prevotellaceae bacterium]